MLPGIDQDHDVLGTNGGALIADRGPRCGRTVPNPGGRAVEQGMETVGEKFVFQLNLRSIGVSEGVHGHVQIKRDFGDGPGYRQQPLQHAGLFRITGRSKTLCLGMPVSGEVVVAWVEHLVEHVVHRLHQIVASAMVRGEIDVALRAPQQTMADDGGFALLVLLIVPNEGVGR